MTFIKISAQTAIHYAFDVHFPPLMTLIPSQHQPAFPYFLHSPRVRRKRQRLPSNLVIENPRQHTFGFHMHRTRRGFPMNANDYASVDRDSSNLDLTVPIQLLHFFSGRSYVVR